jgi:hypothetical protein
MHMETKRLHETRRGWGDAAVDGLLAGGAAGVVMAAYLLAAGLWSGQGWQAILAQFDPQAQPQPWTGALAHLAVAAVYGAGFGMAWRLWPARWPRPPVWAAGLVYGLILLGLALAAVNAQGGGAWLAQSGPVQIGVAHALYGLALGTLMRRMKA